jgi:hypothetical protein
MTGPLFPLYMGILYSQSSGHVALYQVAASECFLIPFLLLQHHLLQHFSQNG